jgi:hypothetical protein
VGASSERIAIDITASANVAEVAKARSEVSALGEVAHKATTTLTEDQKRMAQAIRESDGSIAGIRQRFRELTPAIQQTTLAVEAQTVAVEESATAWRLSSGRIASASVATLFAFEGFARGAAAGESSARAALRSVSLLAFAFGPEVGIPIAGAAALGDALVEMWTRSGKAAANARTEFEKTLETIGHQGFAATAGETQRLFSGDPLARRGAVKDETEREFQIRSQGLVGLQREMTRLRSITQDNTDAWDRAQIKIRELQPILDTQTTKWRESLELQQRLLPVVQERARFELQMLRERAALRESQRLRPEEVPLTIGNLAEQERAFGITGRGGLGIRGVGSIDLAQQAADRAQRVDATGLGRIRAAAITETPFHAMQVEMEKNIEALAAHTQQRLGSSLADALATGITAGFAGGGVKGAFAAAGRTLLAGLGGIFIDLGKTYLEYSGIMQALTPLLGNPFTAGFAGAAIGTALIALGAALEGIGQRGAGGGGGYAGSGGTFTPNAVNGAGGTTVISQTVNPYSREVVAATTYYINRGQMLNTPIIAPPGAPS